MKTIKLKITSDTAHFGKVLGYDDRYTYLVPPPSTVFGILKVIYGEDIDDFRFGYIFESDGLFYDDITIHKRDFRGNRVKKKGKFVTDIRKIQYHHNCKLTIYTDIFKDIVFDYILCLGKSGNIANLDMNFEEVALINKEGAKGYDQFTTKDIGKGKIYPCNMRSIYNPEIDAFDHQIMHLRYNKEFDYSKFYDEEGKQSIFMWEFKYGEVREYNAS